MKERSGTSAEIEDTAIEDKLAEHVRRHILSGHLPPGTKLGEEMLTEVFGVNRSRIRRVLQILAFDRLVDLKANRGAFIASPSIKEARDVFEARRVIERATTEIVARTVLTHQLLELGRIVDAQQNATEQGDRREAVRYVGDFHRYLCGLAHNIALVQALEPLILRTALIIALYGTSGFTLDFHVRHRHLLDLLAGGRAMEASRIMERCLFDLENALELRERIRRDVDVRKTLRMVS